MILASHNFCLLYLFYNMLSARLRFSQVVTEVYFIVEARDRHNQIIVRLSLKRGTF
jgi:hypothetical protein